MKKLTPHFVLLVTLLALAVSKPMDSSAAAKKKVAAAEQPAPPAKAIAVHPFQPVEGVEVALLEVTRSAPDVVTVKWEYRNHNAKPAELAADSKGWSDPYRLSWDTYLLLPDGKTKIGVMRDSDRRPISGGVGRPNQVKITVAPKKNLATWAKYQVPAGVANVTVAIVGADPFENVPVSEPAK